MNNRKNLLAVMDIGSSKINCLQCFTDNNDITKDIGLSTIASKGIVSGVLNDDNSIDAERTKELIELSKPLEFTFHRAFDIVSKPLKEIENLIRLGVDRILTSGQKEKAMDGIVLLQQLKSISNNFGTEKFKNWEDILDYLL